MTFVLLTFLACFPEISKYEEERFPENPNHDYDGDTISDAEDCDDANKDIGRPITYYLDEDGDGFGVESTAQLFCPTDKPDGYVESKERNGLVVFDCDDTPADEDSENGRAIHPDAEEICDFINNDCDDAIDEDVSDAPLWFFDADGDGYGNFSQPTPGCPDEDGNGPPGHVGNFADCDDTNGTVFPNAEETCNEIDDNCNGIVDESLSSDAQIWYADSDGDGFGARNNAQPSCVQPEGFVLDNTDCNDLDATISPVAIESCEGEGEVQIDNDCDGLINEGADSTAPQNSSTFYADVDGDGYGDPNATLIQCDIITGYVTNSEDCNDGDAALNPATVWYQDNDGDGEGSTVNTLVQCTQPTQHVRNSTDCNDADSQLNTQDGDSDGYSTCDGDCDDTDANANLSDADGDGQDSCSGDCNDNDPSIYLNAPETCNSIDDDCDENVDEEDAIDRTAWFADTDGDGEGDGGSIEFACDQPEGFVANLDDCVDTDAAINTSATETCDGVDNNCDGLIDDADANIDLNTATEFFADVDFDGFGTPLQSTFSCLQPPGFVPNSDDCDDNNLLRNPNGFEYCNNIDDNCDGTIDELALDSTDYYVDADGDGHGALVDTATGFDLNSCPSYDPITNLPIFPIGYSSTNDDCDDGDAVISPSANELCSNGIDDNCDGHNTAGATDVSTFLVDADGDTFGSGERDSNGDLAYALDLCVQPYGYVPYSVNDPLDCDDGDFETKPGAVELCNGKRDNCPTDGDNSVPSDERDDDGDGYVECILDASTYVVLDTEEDGFGQTHDVITVNNWSDNTVTILGGEDCDDSDLDAYPGAVELCNGAFENCWDPLATIQNAPELETDDDSDCFVECNGFDANTWEGGGHICEHLNGVGQIVQETVVIGGEDCNDESSIIYVGAAINDPLVCAQDSDFDGEPDCNFLTNQNQFYNYFCSYGLFIPNSNTGLDFTLIPSGTSADGTFTITNDFYMMTTEVTQGMWNTLMNLTNYDYQKGWHGGNEYPQGDDYPAYLVSWEDALAFANALSTLTGKPECYIDTDGDGYFDDLNGIYFSPYDCKGYVLPTGAEWEYAARSGTAEDIWTGNGPLLGGGISNNNCDTTPSILDGVFNPSLDEYGWYCGNNASGGAKVVGQKRPNGHSLYDVHGNLWEWTFDSDGCGSPTGIDPFCVSGLQKEYRGGAWDYYPNDLKLTSVRSYYPDYSNGTRIGFRIAYHP